jgi:hypothetical protein
VLRSFCLASFFELTADLEAGARLDVVLEEHPRPAGPTLYEYRPLVEAFVGERAERLGAREDAVAALAALKDEPAAGIFARAHAETGSGAGEDEALRRTILIPLLVATAVRCGGFDWDDGAFDRAYAELERHLHSARRAYRALVPLAGATAGGPVGLCDGVAVRPYSSGELAAFGHDLGHLLPERFGREVDRGLVLVFERDLDARDPLVPDAPTLARRAVSALRLTCLGAVVPGPFVFEWLDEQPYGTRRTEAVAPTPHGEPTRVDPFRGALAGSVLTRLVAGDADPGLIGAIERWERATLLEGAPRDAELRDALAHLLGAGDGAWAAAIRAAALLGDTAGERDALFRALLALARGHAPGDDAAEPVRRAIVEAALHGDLVRLLEDVDECLLGLAPRPQRLAARVTAIV